MDFKWTEEQTALRKEFFQVCAGLAEQRPPDWGGGLEATYGSDAGWQYHLHCAREFAQRGWLSRHWPPQYGGQGWTLTEQAMFAEARGYYGVPGADIFGVQMLGPTILAAGNEYIKQTFLPPIASAEVMWCEGWSEPNAGSDLASLTTSAVRKGEEYVVNGQKTWITGAHRADWIFLLARTDPTAPKPQAGISFLLADIKTPGITVRPLYYMDGGRLYNEVFLDEVHIPTKNIVGEENQGWAVTRELMGFERSNLEAVMGLQRSLETLVKYFNETKVNGEPMAKNPLVRNRLAEVACELEAARALAYRVADLQGRGEMGLFDASAVKITAGELSRKLAFHVCDLIGPYAQVKTSKWAPMKGLWEQMYQQHFVLNISMGTNEIQRNIIAWFGLGLPRPK